MTAALAPLYQTLGLARSFGAIAHQKNHNNYSPLAIYKLSTMHTLILVFWTLT